jgi:shikimate kinase
MNVVLIGFMGTGKSAIGRSLAWHLEANFLDSDTEIEHVADKTIARLFAEEGEAVFRSLETTLLKHLISLSPPKLGVEGFSTPPELGAVGTVLATGGGMPLRSENAALLRQWGRVVWLTATAEDILERVGPDLSVRPLLAAYQDDPLGRIQSLLDAREPHYAAAADLIWDTSCHPSPTEAALMLAEQLCQPLVPSQTRSLPTETP